MKAIFLLFIFLSGCMSCQFAPDRKNFYINACYNAADCMYRNKANKDKSICMPYMSECNSFNKYMFCLEERNRPDEMTFKECWLYLNQK